MIGVASSNSCSGSCVEDGCRCDFIYLTDVDIDILLGKEEKGILNREQSEIPFPKVWEEIMKWRGSLSREATSLER